jgi:tetratricopeptide (TPR) repeat protein
MTLQAVEKLSATPPEHMVALTLIGNTQKNAKLYPEALDAYHRSLSLAQTEKDKRFERINLNQIGDVLVESNQLDSGLESYLAGSRLSANDNERADNFARIAAVYSSLGKHDLAIEYQVKAVLTEERVGDQDHQANAYLEMGRIYTLAAQYDKAESAIDKTTRLSKEQGSLFWEAKSYYYLALTKAANGQSPAAKALLADAQHICEKIGEQELDNEIKQAQANLK